MLKAQVAGPTDNMRPPRKLLAIACLSTAALLVLSGKSAADDPVIGHVLEMHGDWRLYPGGADSNDARKNDGQRLTMGQAVPAGAAIRVKAPSLNDHIVIIGLDLNILEERRCGQTQACRAPIFLSRKADEAGFSEKLALLLQRVWFRLWNEPYLVSFSRVRGGAPIIADGVVMLKDRSLDLGETLRYARAGRYVFTPTEEVDRQNPEARPTTVIAWDPEARAAVPVGDLSPGLYDLGEDSVEMTHPAGKHLLARVLVCDSTAYPDATAAYQKVRDLADGWGESVDSAVTRAFLRSLLAGMGNCTGSSPISKRD